MVHALDFVGLMTAAAAWSCRNGKREALKAFPVAVVRTRAPIASSTGEGVFVDADVVANTMRIAAQVG